MATTAKQPEALSLDVQERLDAGERSRMPRLVSAFLTTLVTSYWIGPWALLWLAAYVAVERWFNPWMLRTQILPYIGEAPGKFSRVDRNAAINIFIGACLFSAGWAPAWIVGGSDATLIAGLYFGAAVLHSVIYFGRDRLSLAACLVPPALCALTIPFFVSTHWVVGLVSAVTLTQVMLSAYRAHLDRNRIMQRITDIQSKVEAANNASLAKSQFLATMSHELRTPLNAIIGYAEILEEDLTDEGIARGADDAGRIRRSARDLLMLINEILDFSKIEAGRMDVALAPADVREIIDDAVETSAHLASAHGNTVTVDIAENVGEIVTDAQRLRQCLLNLVSNACKFTDSGVVHIVASLEKNAGETYLRIEVADTGCGISKEDCARLFTPFVQVDGSLTRAKGGTGLGLVITKRLAELLGGDVAFESELGKGSTFTIKVRDQQQAHLAAGKDGGPIVLVIEDEASARDLFRRSLGRLPLSIVEAGTAQQGFAAAKELIPALIVLDIFLPDRSGWNLLAEFKAHPDLQNTPVLVVSTDDDRARAIRLGACAHFVKPVDREQLAAAVIRYALADAKPTPDAAPAHIARSA